MRVLLLVVKSEISTQSGVNLRNLKHSFFLSARGLEV